MKIIFHTISLQYLAEIEEHLGVTIPETDRSLKVEADQFDGKVVYGQKRSDKGKLKLLNNDPWATIVIYYTWIHAI